MGSSGKGGDSGRAGEFDAGAWAAKGAGQGRGRGEGQQRCRQEQGQGQRQCTWGQRQVHQWVWQYQGQ